MDKLYYSAQNGNDLFRKIKISQCEWINLFGHSWGSIEINEMFRDNPPKWFKKVKYVVFAGSPIGMYSNENIVYTPLFGYTTYNFWSEADRFSNYIESLGNNNLHISHVAHEDWNDYEAESLKDNEIDKGVFRKRKYYEVLEILFK